MSLTFNLRGVRQRTSVVLAVLLTLHPAGSWAGPGAGSPAPGPSALRVRTNPDGATVYVDGRLVGATPLSLANVTAGDHRVRVVKGGFLENARVVHVTAGRPIDVHIVLTKDASPAVADQVVSGTTGGGGGSKKWLWIGLAGAAAAGLAVGLKDRNEAPTAGSISVTPGTALQSATAVSFVSSGASDPDGDPLTFAWDFGDGGSGTGQNATHSYGTAGTFSIKLTVSDGKKSATATGSVTVRSLSGTWVGPTFRGFRFTLTQNGSSISGSYSDGDGPGTVSGTVSSNGGIALNVNQPGFGVFAYSGTIDSSINSFSGTVLGIAFTATRQ